MACFVAPLTEAIVTTVATKVVEKHEPEQAAEGHIKFSEKLTWLNKMLWGGSALLAFEHIWHGEVIATAPFLTATKDGQTSLMVHELLTTGVLMAVLVTAVWGGMVAVSSLMEKKAAAAKTVEEKV
ncbi:MAG: hypothetical protein MJ108_10125 [Saccharofermentans sp.]|nr:hypothetical protein [Saccharofermentans sp.]